MPSPSRNAINVVVGVLSTPLPARLDKKVIDLVLTGIQKPGCEKEQEQINQHPINETGSQRQEAISWCGVFQETSEVIQQQGWQAE